jgi:predicted GNAT family N-acyltransferase
VKLQHFHLEIAEWSRERDRAALEAVRHAVFVVEHGVPAEMEQDGRDDDAAHLLARDDSGQAIGCGRLTSDRTIGRLAVLPGWRGQGVGMAVLRGLIERARRFGWPEVSLTALTSARDFYEREGFVVDGAPFDEAGLPHQTMRRSLAPVERAGGPTREDGTLPAGNRDEVAAARLQLLGEARHRLCIHLPLLDNDSYGSAAELAELRRIATSGRGAQIRILLHDPAAALRNSHRLVALAQRLPSALQVRTPVDETDLACASAYLLTDAGGCLFLPEADRPQGRASRCDRAAQAPLQQSFDETWERAQRATLLQPLDL